LFSLPFDSRDGLAHKAMRKTIGPTGSIFPSSHAIIWKERMAALIGIPLLIVAPVVLAAWLGSRLRWAVAAFLLAWLATPLITILFTIIFSPLMSAMSPPGNDGSWVIMIPIYSVGSGLIAGIAAAIVVGRRKGA